MKQNEFDWWQAEEHEGDPIGMTPIFEDTRPWVIADCQKIAEKMKE